MVPSIQWCLGRHLVRGISRSHDRSLSSPVLKCLRASYSTTPATTANDPASTSTPPNIALSLRSELPGTAQPHRCFVFLDSPIPISEFGQRFSTKVQRELLIRLVRMGGVVNFAWFGSESSPYPSAGGSSSDPGWHSGVAFTPYSGRIPLPKVSLDNVDEVVQLLSQHMNPPESSEPPRTSAQDDIIDIYVCTHGARDCRCGETGGAVFRALKHEVDRLGVGGKVKVGEVGHVGGHKYAANVLVYPHGEWLGLVTLSDVPSILSAILSRPVKPHRKDDPLLLPEHWRGRMGLGKDEQIELFGKLCTAPLGGMQ